MRCMLFIFFLRYLCMGDAQIRFVEDEATTKYQLASMDVDIYNRQSMGHKKLAYIQEKNSYEKFVDEIITKGVVDLGFNMHRSAKKLNKIDDNYTVYSPISIASALYMLLLGANGNTFIELSKILGVSQGLNIANNSEEIHEEFGALLRSIEASATDGGLVKFANGLFVQNGFPLRQQYKDVSKIVYQNEVMNLDFKSNPEYSKNYINNWTLEKTFGKIDKILQNIRISDSTIAILVSSLYFKADWAYQFDSSHTNMQTFYPDGKLQPSHLKIPIMVNAASYLYYNDSTLNCEIVGLPYKGHEYTMYFIIPYHSNKEQLKYLESRLAYSEVKRLTSSVEKKDMILAIPKMKLTSSFELQDILEDNGLRTLFSPRESDLGLLSGSGESTNVLQSGIKVDQPFIFTRSKIDPTNDEDDGTKTNRRRKRQLRVISSNRYEKSLDALRHILNKEQNHASSGLFVSQVLHKVVVDVNEKATEAAAATAVSITKSGLLTVKVNVPFLFFIQHEASGLILFWGSVVTPSPVYT